ncbi:MAG: mobile mystery protein B [Thermodesulfobacteriota bacterium]
MSKKKIINHSESETPLDPDELTGLKLAHVTTRSELNHLEQANIQSGMRWMLNRNRSDILSINYVRDLHKHLFGKVWNWAGMFRKTGKNIGIDASEISVQLHILLEDVQYWIENKTYPSYEIAMRFHHRLVSIHPFPNGNGRHARIMTDALLIKLLNLPSIDWSGGYNLDSMKKRRKDYIHALREADKGNYQPLFEFVNI